MVKAVFFDLYGTLAGFEPSRYSVQSQACSDFGIQVTRNGIVKGYAAADAYMSRENAVRHMRLREPGERDRFFAEYERLVLKGSGVEVSQAQALQIWRRLREIPYGLSLFEDVVPTLGALRAQGLTLGLITNMDREGGDIANDLGLDGHLDLTVTSLEVGATKPDPAIFRAALSKAGTDPQEAVHVGDQPSSDVQGAIATGISAVLLDRDGIHRDYADCPRIESLLELPSMLGLNRRSRKRPALRRGAKCTG